MKFRRSSARVKVRAVVVRCSDAGPCDFHRDGASDPRAATLRCPYYCDRPGCDAEAVLEPYEDGACYCRPHAAETIL